MSGPEEFCRDEYFDHLVYSMLARAERNPTRRRILERLAEDERRHYEFWRRIAGGSCEGEAGGWRLLVYRLLRLVFGLTFTVKLLERHEEDVVEAYKAYAGKLSGEERRLLEEIIEDEERHERELAGQIDEAIVKYMSFIVLGLADAITEITGVHAGFLGATSSTLMAGIAGLVVGFAAALSMASAAYLQAKHELGRSPIRSALATGIAYIGAVVVLALPYFTIPSMLLAFTASVLTAVAMIAVFSFYSAVVLDKAFKREFAEAVALMLGTAFGAYLFGEALGQVFGVKELLAH